MPAEEQQTQLTVVNDDVGGKALQHGHQTVSADLCQQSGTLRELLDTEGPVQLPLSPELFQAWLAFATSGAGATAEAAGAQAAAGLSSTARLVEVSQFVRHAAAEERAATRIAVVLRRAYRRDLRASDRSLRTSAVRALQPLECYMLTEIPGGAGERLRAASSTLPPLAPVAAAAVARHLTLCEALLLPAPFPAEALAHTLSLTAGVLDLSPPRVPVHTPATLLAISRLLAGILPAAPPLTALRIPAPCL